MSYVGDPPGIWLEMDAVVTIEEVRTFDTRGGNVRYVVRASDGT